MAAFNLVSLVLRGVAVRCDSVNVELRHETGYKASPETPEIPFSMRHPSQGYTQEPFGNPADRHDLIIDVGGADSGAGRSLGLAGVLRRSTPTTLVGQIVLGRSEVNGATVLPATASPSTLPTTATATGHTGSSRQRIVSSARLSIVAAAEAASSRLQRSEMSEAWCKPATRTPPASTWGQGIR
jgi:hypothetical protein